jgi:hypothetical protein
MPPAKKRRGGKRQAEFAAFYGRWYDPLQKGKGKGAGKDKGTGKDQP